VAPGKRTAKSSSWSGAKWWRRGKESHRRVFTWFANRCRNHRSKRAEKPHSITQWFWKTERWAALLRGR